MDLFPLLLPPPGVVPNFVNPDNQNAEAISCVTICLTFMVLFVMMRLYAKTFISKSIGWDDYVCILAALGTAAFAGVFLSSLSHGIGTHQWELTIGRFKEYGYIVVFIFAAGYGPVGFLVKLSVFLLYLRIFWVNKLVRVMTYVGISFAFLYHATATTLYFAFCWPRNNQKWMFSYMSPRCRYNGHLLSIILSVLNTVTDIYILCIPISAVMGLQMSSKRKIQAMIAFMTGSLACIANLASTIIRAKTYNDLDGSWFAVPVFNLTIVELSVGVICSCMPACMPLLRQVSPHLSSFKSLRSHLFSSKGRSSRSKPYASSDRTPSPNISEPKPVHQDSHIHLEHEIRVEREV